MAQPSSLPSVGTRLVHSGYLGTIRFVGPVDGTQGPWLGVEWDDSKRGKHDGDKDGKKYFHCTVKNAGSFIRPNAAISYGVSFLEALVAKYNDDPNEEAVEKVILGSSNGAIEVEAVRLNKIRANLSRLDTLREVSLDNERVARADTPGEIQRTCPNIRGLDLSKNLIPSWDIVALIVAELPQLKQLALNHNRLAMPQDTRRFSSAFSSIQEIQLNTSLIPWSDLKHLLKHMLSLTVIEYGYNGLSSLLARESDAMAHTNTNDALRVINFDSNELTDWAQLVTALQCYPKLERVILSSNKIKSIDPLGEALAFKKLRHLSLMANALDSWQDVDRLHLWCPALESLTFSGNPVVEDPVLGRHARQFTIAKIPTLKTLDAGVITAKERTDCELFYISYIIKHGPRDNDERCRQHPQWKALCIKYDQPNAPTSSSTAVKQDNLNSRLIDIKAHRCSRPPSTSIPSRAETMLLRVLPTMLLRTFRLKVAKSFGVHKAEQAAMKLWLAMPDGTSAYLDGTQDTQDLSRLGFEDDSEILMYISTQRDA
ncbi:hypothetical protein BDY19DRAFT_919480 [Irpex rosettiformis]|uniref:Uncharacterized protein n=1 Tax=Irpex rosettiformis TaxID=378272 RepID=A0ACB8UHP7_9APHY|nr:hypothetical protein BDY19DRAFT_919480 [Irpex rosettiformis]